VATAAKAYNADPSRRDAGAKETLHLTDKLARMPIDVAGPTARRNYGAPGFLQACDDLIELKRPETRSGTALFFSAPMQVEHVC